MEHANQEKKIHVETWGCQMNVADSEHILSIMADQKYTITHEPEDADLIVLNTCHIREKAKHKVLSRLGVLKELKKKNKGLTIAVSGCVAQAEGKKLLKQSPAIDILMGPGKISELPGLMKQREITGNQAIAIGFDKPTHKLKESEVFAEEYVQEETSCIENLKVPENIKGKNEVSRFVNIQQGCDNFCTFCVVPFTRGREISEDPRIIYAKAKALVKTGAKEITLLGQNVNSYGHDFTLSNDLQDESSPFVKLLQKVSQIEGLERLRFTTSNPHDLTKPLADLFRTHKKLGSYYHLPVQSGSDRILKVMKRKVTAEEYFEKVSWLRQAVPDIAISTDLIVGFPGETEEDFQQTLELVKKVRFCFAYAFMYSPRKGTAAIRFRDQIPEEVKADRLKRLNMLQDQVTIELNQAEVGRDNEVLFLYKSDKEADIYYGRSRSFRLVRVHSQENLIGKTRMVKISAANKTALQGSLL